MQGHKDVVELLLANKAEVNAKANDGGTPLHAAASGGNKDVVELLLASKAEVNAKDNQGMTPLHLAEIWKHADLVELLLANGADVNATDNRGGTPWVMRWPTITKMSRICCASTVATNKRVSFSNHFHRTSPHRASTSGLFLDRFCRRRGHESHSHSGLSVRDASRRLLRNFRFPPRQWAFFS